MTTITIPISPEVLDFLNEEAEETGVKNHAGIISDIILKYKRDRYLKSLYEAEEECANGGGWRGDLDEIVDKNF